MSATIYSINHNKTQFEKHFLIFLGSIISDDIDQLYTNDPIKKSVEQRHAASEPYSTEQPLKLLDLGSRYIEPANLAIWLIKWATRFQKLLMTHKTAACFRHSATAPDHSPTTTLKLTSVNANFLVACVYLANNNNLESSALNPRVSPAKRADTLDEDLTQISNSFSVNQTWVIE